MMNGADLRYSSRDSHPLARIRRRAISVSAIVFGFVVGCIFAIPVLLAGAVADLAYRRPFPTIRVVLYGLWWLAIETTGVFLAGLLWVRYGLTGRITCSASQMVHSRVQHWWVRSLINGARTILGFRYSVEGAEQVTTGGPLVVLARHGSQGDALLVASVLASTGFRPRFVVKRQLLWDPCLDLFGHRIPNYFVDRDSQNNQHEIHNIGLLAKGMARDETLVIFPEGTRFSQAKLTRAMEVLTETAPERLEQVGRLRHVLPIRTSGVLAVLKENQKADLILLNHVGVADFSTLGDLWNNTPFPNELRFHLERIDRSEVPETNNSYELIRYLDQRWTEFDNWIQDRGVAG